MKDKKNIYQSRRDFVRKAGKVLVAASLVAIPLSLVRKTSCFRICLADRSS